jgi:hypothetical protein
MIISESRDQEQVTFDMTFWHGILIVDVTVAFGMTLDTTRQTCQNKEGWTPFDVGTVPVDLGTHPTCGCNQSEASAERTPLVIN